MANLPQVKDVYYDSWLENLPSLEGKTIAITGTTSGTGYWAAVACIRKNATCLMLLNRSSPRSDESLEKLEGEKSEISGKTEIIQVDCDLMSFESVRKAAEKVNEIANEKGGLNVLINNAGIMMFPDNRTEDGFDQQMQTNHLSHFLLTKLVFPSFELALKNGQEVRICQHSSGARAFGSKLKEKYFQKAEPKTLGGDGVYACAYRYHMTKLSNTCFALKLHKELIAHGFDVTKIKSVVAEPGMSVTSLTTNLITAQRSGGSLYGWFVTLSDKFQAFAMKYILPVQSAPDGSLPLIEASFGDDVESGDFYYPEKTSRGKPVKGISKGEVAKKPRVEAGTMSAENQNLLWTASEEALGIKFFDEI